MDAGRPRFEADRRERDELAARFFDAFTEGDVDALRELLAADATMVGDSGGKAPHWARPIAGVGNVARVLAAMWPWLVPIGVQVDPHEVNGQPGAIFRDRDGKVLLTWTLEVLDGRIQTIRSVLNPDKLGHVGPVADAWAVFREANQARRPAVGSREDTPGRSGLKPVQVGMVVVPDDQDCLADDAGALDGPPVAAVAGV
jgi:RNA polymerase sigma-70 factor (ECF subfamily)